MNKNITYVLTIMLLFGLLAPTVMAQMGGNNNLVDRLRAELDKTEALINQAKEAVQQSQSAKAMVALNQAINLQENARTEFGYGTQNGYTKAAIMTQKARDLAKYAIANGQFNEQNDNAVLRKLERTTDMLRKFQEEISGVNNPQLEGLLNSAEDNLNLAWEFYRDGSYRPAYKICTQIENSLKKLYRQTGQAQQNYERMYQHVEERLRAMNQLQNDCASIQAETLLKQAEEALMLAAELKQQNRAEAAMKALQNANATVNKASRLCSGLDDISIRLEKLKLDAERLSELITTDNENALKLLGQVNEQIALAEDFLANGDYKSASAAMKAAQLLLDQSVDIINIQ